ncbi:hypothetical protein P7D31_12890 [Enterococcus dongliensis]|uniref:hypothetical protein n=1 Tax=Enterococcus dongliensis TaxID=2559925 RepID=UPI00288D0480|nr:hypothetical protein [Enterococcus dongliensis]MDT2640998.1 hypothetical protein [Enterococcus dongliensis]
MVKRKKEDSIFKKAMIIGSDYLKRKENEMLNKQKALAEQPLYDYEYLLAIFWFLIEESTELTGIDFLNRFENICDKEILLTNQKLRAEGKPPLSQRHPDFITAIERSNLVYIMELFKRHFIKFERLAPYDCTIRYKISGEEKLNLVPPQEMTLAFQENYIQSRAYNGDSLRRIACDEVKLNGVYLEFHLFHYGKWNPHQNSKGEISLEDDTF